MEETKELTKTIQDRRDLKQQFKHRTDKMTQDLEADKRSYGDQLANEKVKHVWHKHAYFSVLLWVFPPPFKALRISIE